MIYQNGNFDEILLNKFFFIPKKLNNDNYYEFDDLILTKTPYHSSLFNICWVNKINPIYFENSMKKTIEYFSPKPFSLWFYSDDFPDFLNEILNKLSFSKKNNKIGMSYDLNNFDLNKLSIEKHKITEIRSDNELEEFLNVIDEYEPCARGYFKKISKELGFSKDNPYRYFYLSIFDKPISIASLYFHNDNCGLFDVFTHPNFRRKGYALNLFLSLLDYAKMNGAKKLFLTTSFSEKSNENKLVEFYKKIGFYEDCKYICFEYEGSGF
jgi:GNAT superfamily N-acetyltransferase